MLPIDLSGFTRDKRAQGASEAVTRMVSLGVLLAITVVVLNAVFDALPAPGDDSGVSDAWNSTVDLTGTAMEIAPILLIVLVAAVILGILSRRF